MILNIEIIAHRGFSSIAPENTLAAFEAAIQHQADSIEFDLQISADGIPVIFHDENLDRITGYTGKIQDNNIQILKNLPAGTWFSHEFDQEKIPTLAEALNCLTLIKRYLYFDVKPHCQWAQSDIEKLIQLLINKEAINQSILTSFDEHFIAQCRQVCSTVKVGYFVTDITEFEQQLGKAKSTGNAIISSWYKVLLEDPSWVKKSQEQGIDIVAWTVDRQKDLQQLVQIGVKRIITNSLIGNQYNPD